MKIGIIGLQKSGKTTIFNALTESDAETAAYTTSKVEPNIGVVEVRDSRVTELSDLYSPKKTVYAAVEFTDFAGLSSGDAKSGLFSGTAMGLIKTTDALCIVLRNFRDDTIDAALGPPRPVSDLTTIEEELIFSDLIITEKRLERIASDIDRGKKTPELVAEQKVLDRVKGHLDEVKPLRDLELSEEEARTILGFQFLSRKPVLVILNSDESSYGENEESLAKISENYKVLEFAGKFEMELSRLDQEDAGAFMEDFGITESVRDRLIRFAYAMLGYVSFFTVGEDEVRAWTIHRGTKAVDAAGEIHSDLQRGFIRAECFTCADLLDLGSEKAVKEKGRFRLEGKEYIVQDGDILHIRFSA